MADKPLTPPEAQAEELAFSALQLQRFDLEIAYEAKRAFQEYYGRQREVSGGFLAGDELRVRPWQRRRDRRPCFHK